MKETIVAISLQQFLKNGIRNMTVSRLVAPLGISTKTVYKYFKSKEELLKESLVLLYSQYNQEFELVLKGSEDPPAKLLAIFQSTLEKDFGIHHNFFHDLNYYYPKLQNLVIARFTRQYAQKFSTLLEQGIQTGFFLPAIRIEIILKTLELLYTDITRSKDYKTHKPGAASLFYNSVGLYIRGICTEKGIAIIDIKL